MLVYGHELITRVGLAVTSSLQNHSNHAFFNIMIATLGPPGSGKSTLCRALAEIFGTKTISPGTELRRIAAGEGEAAEEARTQILQAQPVSDDFMMRILEERRPEQLALDGIPRNAGQVGFLADYAGRYGYHIIGVHLLLGRRTAQDRIATRWYCSRCRATVAPGKSRCTCGGVPQRRLDDKTRSTIEARLDQYELEVVPAAKIFSSLFQCREFDASRESTELIKAVTDWVSRVAKLDGVEEADCTGFE